MYKSGAVITKSRSGTGTVQNLSIVVENPDLRYPDH
jgi:hypothetical protein